MRSAKERSAMKRSAKSGQREALSKRPVVARDTGYPFGVGAKQKFEGVLRPDGIAKTKGEFAFTSDLFAEGFLWGRTLRSPHASARIISIAFKEAPRTMFPANSGVGSAGPDHLALPVAVYLLRQPRLACRAEIRPGQVHRCRVRLRPPSR